MKTKTITRTILLMAVLLLSFSMTTAQIESDTTLTVERGDVLDVIAAALDVSLDCLTDANDLVNPGRISPGLRLVVPADCPTYDGLSTVSDAQRTAIQARTGLSEDDDAEVVESPDMEDVTPVGEDDLEDDDTDEAEADESDDTDTTDEDEADDTDATAATSERTLNDDGTYTVRWGDNLTRIASDFGTSVNCLTTANAIFNPDLVYAGQRLVINTDCSPTSPPPSDPDDPSRRVCGGDRNPLRTITDGTYTVQSGDVLDFIACDLGISLSCLINTNPQLGSPARIDPGDVLIIDFSCPAWDGPPGPLDIRPRG